MISDYDRSINSDKKRCGVSYRCSDLKLSNLVKIVVYIAVS